MNSQTYKSCYYRFLNHVIIGTRIVTEPRECTEN